MAQNKSNGEIHCPHCGKKLFRFLGGTVDIETVCGRCKNVVKLVLSLGQAT